MKILTPILISLIALGGLGCCGPNEHWSRESAHVSLEYFAQTNDSIVNPVNQAMKIDTSGVAFNVAGKTTHGVMELTGASQQFHLKVENGVDTVDSICAKWGIKVSKGQLFVAGTQGSIGVHGSKFHTYTPLQGKGNSDSLTTIAQLDLGGLAGNGHANYMASGGLAVVVITIDPADSPQIIPLSIQFKLKGSTDWVDGMVSKAPSAFIPLCR